MTFAVDEDHSEYDLPHISLYNKRTLFTIPYLNIYLGFELSIAVREIQRLMCYLKIFLANIHEHSHQNMRVYH